MNTGGGSSSQYYTVVDGSPSKPTGCRYVGCACDRTVGSSHFGHPPAGTIPYPPKGFGFCRRPPEGACPNTLYVGVVSHIYKTVGSHNFGHRPEGGVYCPPRVMKYDIGCQSVRSRTLCTFVWCLIFTRQSGPNILDTLKREGSFSLQRVLRGSRLSTSVGRGTINTCANFRVSLKNGLDIGLKEFGVLCLNQPVYDDRWRDVGCSQCSCCLSSPYSTSVDDRCRFRFMHQAVTRARVVT